jgi:uncharacterized protein
MKSFARRMALVLLSCAFGTAHAEVVISQAYGGGGNSGAPVKSDFIELHNNGAIAADVSGWSVQYTSAAGTTWQKTDIPAGTSIPAGGYLLIRESQGAGTQTDPWTFDIVGSLSMGGSSFKVALVNSGTLLSACSPNCAAAAGVVDFVGAGATATEFEGSAPAPAPSNSLAVMRGDNGCTDTNSNNVDFATGAPAARNSASTAIVCGGSGGPPTLSISDTAADEGDSGTSPFFFTISSNQAAPAGGISVDYATSDGTAAAGSDYTGTSGAATIAEGNTSVTISVDVTGDTSSESNETFAVVLSNPTGATIADGQGTGTITNDDVTITKIHEVQGSGLASPMTGASVWVEGIVTAVTSSGYFLQEEDADADDTVDTSEGIFVFTSSAPPLSAAVGNKVRAYGQVQEYVPSNSFYQSYTELGATPVTSLRSTGNALPESVDLNYQLVGADYSTPVLERYEAMRVHSSALTVVAPSGGNIDEVNATSTSDGTFFAVIPDVTRPFREPGVPRHELDVAAANAYAAPKYDGYAGYTGPVFDENWERIRVRATSPLLSVGAGDSVTDLQGVLDVFQGNYTVLVDAAGGAYAGPTVAANHPSTAARLPNDDEITVSGANLERLWDTVDAAGKDDEIATPAAYASRLAKDARVVCQMMHAPDIFGAVEVENITVLQDLAAAIDDTANSGCATAPHYQAYLVEGNDIGGIDVGYLVKTAEVAAGVPRVVVDSVTQVGKDTLFTNADNSTELLNDRPSLILDATVNSPNGAHEDLTVIVNHLKALSSVNSTAAGSKGWGTVGARNRAKRWEQAKFLAGVVQDLQTADPGKRIVMVGDFNAFQFNDGLVDVMGIITGTASGLDSDTVLPGDGGAALVDNPLTNLIEFKPAAERYSYSFDGNAQVLDQALINQPATMAFRYDVDHPRINGDFPVSDFGDYSAGSMTRISDHDPVVVYLASPAFQTADLQVTASAPAQAVSPLVFNATVSNNGPDVASYPGVGFAFNLELPELQIHAPADWSCDVPQIGYGVTTVACATTSLASGATAEFSLDTVIPSGAAYQTLTMEASANATTTDTVTDNNSAAAGIAIPGYSDLWLQLQLAESTATQNTYLLNVVNAGPDEDRSAHLVFDTNLPASLVSFEQPPGWSCTLSTYATRLAGTCDLDVAAPVSNGGMASFQLVMPKRLVKTSYYMHAEVDSATDTNPSNNTLGRRLGMP